MKKGMKKVFVIAVVLLLACSSVFAGDFKFIFAELDQHPEILAGFCPTLTAIGASYEGLELIDGNLTQFQAIVGGGYHQYVLYQDPKTGEPLMENQGIYDSIQFRWNLRMRQGFGSSWVEGKDLVTAYAGYEGRLEKNINSMALGKERKRGYKDYKAQEFGKSEITAINDWFTGFDVERDTNKMYPDLAGGEVSFMNNFYLGATLNLMEDKMVSNKGFLGELKIQFAPSFLNKKASYYSITLNAVAGTTLYKLQSSSTGRNLLSIVLIDRINVNWTDGSKVPVYAQQGVSLGRKVRGFNTGSYNTNFTVVNNFDIRFAGPELFINGIFPRLNLFFDMGFHSGSYFNTKISASSMAEKYGLKQFLCSTGAQLEVSFFDFIDLGIQVAYLISGRNMRDPKSNVIIGATFFLDF